MKNGKAWLVAVVVVLATTVGLSQVKTLIPLPVDLTGELNGVPYRISVPVNWNGTLLVYAHGYTGQNPPALTLLPADANTLLSRGFGLAASKFAGSGWNVKEGMQNTANLTAAFRGMVGNPKRTIMWGGSMGGLMTLGMIEKFPGLYDGAIALCPPASGTPRRFDLGLDIALAYAVAFKSIPDYAWRPEWGTPGDIRDDLNFATEVAPYLAGEGTPANPRPDLKGRWEFIRRLNRIPIDSYFLPLNFKATNMYFATGVRAELEHRAGGAVAENLGRSYSLSDADKTEILVTYGVDVEPFLAEMNLGVNQFAADPNARNYVEHYVNPTGRITRPVITLHSAGDALAIPSHERAYLDMVTHALNTNLLVQQFTTGPYHCAFTSAQDIAAVDAMMYWLDTGNRPDDSFFTAPGFWPGFVPDPWPW